MQFISRWDPNSRPAPQKRERDAARGNPHKVFSDFEHWETGLRTMRPSKVEWIGEHVSVVLSKRWAMAQSGACTEQAGK